MPKQRTTILCASTFFLALMVCSCAPDGDPIPEYAGRQACLHCHPDEESAFTGSDHDLAMDIATDRTVLGDFDDAEFEHLGTTARFFRQGGKFFVTTEGVDGVRGDYEVRYTFGVHPLQQYLVEFDRGRVQCLPYCWDTRPREEGGQRWFHIYDQERISPDEIVYWTHPLQRWNYMCAECHSTNLRKGYDFESDSYHTTWSEIDVSCEACHGPGSQHREWAESVGERRNAVPNRTMGLTVRFAEKANWEFTDTSWTARRVPTRRTPTQIDVCARCHSRRSGIKEGYVDGRSFLNTHNPSLLREDLYFADGQIRDEVYVYGSFLQSKMFQKGVVCTDCHDPHTARLYAEGNALCYRCHNAEKFGSPAHHFHKQGNVGSHCVECHMPARTYMVVDPRRDHSFRIPRPDLSPTLDTPNACASCHKDKSSEWIISHFTRWYGTPKGRTYGEIFHAAGERRPEARRELQRIIQADDTPLMVRATAVSLLVNYPETSSWEMAMAASRHEEPLVRMAAVEALSVLTPPGKMGAAARLLADSVRLVRIQAARFLAGASEDQFTTSEISLRDNALSEYEESQLLNADFPASLLNLGNLYLSTGESDRAEEMYKKAIEVEPAFLPSYVNLADLYREAGREAEGQSLLEKAASISPENAAVQHSLGLLFVRVGKKETAMVHLARSFELDPENARYSYVYAAALSADGLSGQAIEVLEKGVRYNPYDSDILISLVSLYQTRGDLQNARFYLARLLEMEPENRQLLEMQRLLSTRPD